MRICSHCGKAMSEGYVIAGGIEYYCSDACLHEHYTPEEWEDMYDDDGENYWTEWENEENDANSLTLENLFDIIEV